MRSTAHGKRLPRKNSTPDRATRSNPPKPTWLADKLASMTSTPGSMALAATRVAGGGAGAARGANGAADEATMLMLTAEEALTTAFRATPRRAATPRYRCRQKRACNDTASRGEEGNPPGEGGVGVWEAGACRADGGASDKYLKIEPSRATKRRCVAISGVDARGAYIGSFSINYCRSVGREISCTTSEPLMYSCL